MSQTILNLVLGASSFVFLFSTVVMDMFDRTHGKFFTRMICILGLLFNISYLMKNGVDHPEDGRMYYWFVITLMFFLRKVYQLKGKGVEFEKGIEKGTRIIHQSFIIKHKIKSNAQRLS